jgi:hypothetical protein
VLNHKLSRLGQLQLGNTINDETVEAIRNAYISKNIRIVYYTENLTPVSGQVTFKYDGEDTIVHNEEALTYCEFTYKEATIFGCYTVRRPTVYPNNETRRKWCQFMSCIQYILTIADLEAAVQFYGMD